GPRGGGGGFRGAPVRGGGVPPRPGARAGAAGDAAEDHDHGPRGARPVRGVGGRGAGGGAGLLRAGRQGGGPRGLPPRPAPLAGERAPPRRRPGEPERVLSAAVQQFYADGRYVPREALVPADIPDRELLQAWLSKR